MFAFVVVDNAVNLYRMNNKNFCIESTTEGEDFFPLKVEFAVWASNSVVAQKHIAVDRSLYFGVDNSFVSISFQSAILFIEAVLNRLYTYFSLIMSNNCYFS